MDRSAAESIRENVRAHDRVAARYATRHREIFNPIEQGRLRESLRTAAGFIETSTHPPIALDLGCGTGNLTGHLLDLGFEVVAADVSPRFLRMIQERFAPTRRVRIARLNGADLANLDSDSFDLVAAYSVLHHVPDYVALVCETARVARPGGVIHLDHEVQETYWDPTPEYLEYRSAIAPPAPAGAGSGPDPRRFLRPATYWRKLRQWCSPRYWGLRHNLRKNPRYNEEGDLHVWPDDHIEWDWILKALEDSGCEIVARTDYLLYRGTYPESIFRRYEHCCHDMRCLTARKSQTGAR